MHFKTDRQKFSMKLLIDQNVLLVEYPGREPQLFMPALLDNAIVLENITIENNSPLPGQKKRNLPHHNKTPTAKKLPAHSDGKQKSLTSSSGINASSIGSNSFQWVRFGSSTKQTRSGVQLLPSEEPTVSVVGPALTPSGTVVPGKTRAELPKSKTAPSFDAIRRLYYLETKRKVAQILPTSRQLKIKAASSDQMSRVSRSVRG